MTKASKVACYGMHMIFVSRVRLKFPLLAFRFDDGLMMKIKTMWYHDLNRGLHMMTKTKQNNERFMWRTILDHKYDDMKVKRMMA